MSVTVDVRDLTGSPGSLRSVHVAEAIAGLGTGLSTVPADRPVAGDLLLESVVEGILVTGPLVGSMLLTCARCLRPFQAEFRLDIQELFASGAQPDDDDEYSLEEGVLDLEPMIRDAVMLAMPFAPLCRTDCLGLCPRCGGDRNAGECACPPEVDERWAPLLGPDLDQGFGASNERTP